MEIIEIRALHKAKSKLEDELQQILSDMRKETGEFKIKIYSRINLETDFIILIMSESVLNKGSDSHLGIRLSEGLKDYGMVNYSKWQELPVTRNHQ